MAGSRFIGDALAILVAVETTPGTYTAPTLSLYLERGEKPPKVEFGKISNDPMAGTGGWKHDIPAPSTGKTKATLKTRLTANKAAIEPLLHTANFAGTAVTSPDGTSYQLITAGTQTLSAKWVGLRSTFKAKGGKAALSIKGEIGKPIDMEFQYEFKYEGEENLVAAAADNTIPAPVVPDFLYLVENCDSIKINGVNGHFESFDLDWGADVKSADTACPSTAYIEDYTPTIKLTQSLTEENEASWDELKTAGEKNIVIGLYDIAGTRKAEIRVPKAKPSDLDPDSADGRLKTTKTFACLPTAGDDNVQLVILD